MEFVNRTRQRVIAPVTSIDEVVREAQATVIQERISAANLAHTAPLGRRLDDHAMAMTYRINAADRAERAVLARVDAMDR